MKGKVLITGSSGFIGSHLTKLFDNFTPCDLDCFDGKNSQEYALMKITNKEVIAVYHLGAISSTTETDIGLISDTNITLSSVLLDACIEAGIPFVYASSASVYGLGKNGFCEDTVLTPLNYYAISKSAFDKIAMQKIIDNPSSEIVGLRYFNVYGPGEEHKHDQASPVHKFLKQARTNGRIKIFEGSHGFKRDFIHVDNVAQITKSAIFFDSGIYNVGTNNPRSFFDVAKIISDLTGADIEEVAFPSHLIGKYQDYTCSDNSKINSQISSDRIDLEEGIFLTKEIFDAI